MRAPKKQGRVPWGNAVMGESRVEFFRHKDAVEFLAARPDLLGLAGAKPLPAAGSPQARAAAGAVLELLVRRRAAVRAERIFWKPRPGEELKFFFSLFVPCLVSRFRVCEVDGRRDHGLAVRLGHLFFLSHSFSLFRSSPPIELGPLSLKTK
jgi:hypothetical protein